jgi:flagellin-like protein
MKSRKGISPFLATVMLVTITLMIGGLLYTQFRQTIVSQVRNPSLTLIDENVAPDGQSITFTIKNDGNVLTNVKSVAVLYGASTDSFSLGSNATIIAGGAGLVPGALLTARLKTSFTIPQFSTFTLTVVGDQVARAFNVQA